MKGNVSYTKLIVASLITFLIATTVWLLDITDKLCSPTSIFQGHSLWHLLTAVSIFLAYLFYRSEEFLTTEEREIMQPLEKLA
ncbi:MAG: hypothetical protein IPM95_02605 [Sphingobacteriales bacterium]|nr:hypothetical protein [Sphingobacteriales bacterium]